jgi:hypothetical protein
MDDVADGAVEQAPPGQTGCCYAEDFVVPESEVEVPEAEGGEEGDDREEDDVGEMEIVATG